MTSDLPDLARTLAELERYANKGSEMMNLGPARVALMTDAARLLRHLALRILELERENEGLEEQLLGEDA